MNANISVSRHEFPVATFPSLKSVVLIVMGLVLLVSAVLVMASASVQEPVQSNLIPIAVAVPVAPAVDAQVQPAVTATPAMRG